MDKFRPFESRLQALREARERHGLRTVTLLSDLALVGLVDDVIDATETALELLLGDRPHRSYMMARVAFEAVQRLLILATADDFVKLGTRAWLYYQAKDAQFRLPVVVAGDLSVENQIIRVWADHHPQALSVVAEQRAALAKARGPDNFVSRNLAECAEEAYSRLAAFRGGHPDPKTAAVDKSLYSFLCRDSHACLRLDPRGFKIRPTGEVVVVPQARDSSIIRRNVIKGLESCLRDAVVAVEYRISIRASGQPSQIGQQPSGRLKGLPPGFLPDLGVELMEKGLGATPVKFPGVPVHRVKELPDGALSFSISDSEPPEGHTATFDLRDEQREVLLRRLGKVTDPSNLRGAQPIDIRLQEPLVLTITAVLGAPQKTATEEFVPFNVIAIE